MNCFWRSIRLICADCGDDNMHIKAVFVPADGDLKITYRCLKCAQDFYYTQSMAHLKHTALMQDLMDALKPKKLLLVTADSAKERMAAIDDEKFLREMNIDPGKE